MTQSTAAPPPALESALPPRRRHYRGSCHCGQVQYIASMALPPRVLSPTAGPKTGVRIRKCNCSTCHKMAFFHVRVPDSPQDFLLLKPTDVTELGDYTCFERRIHWFFCKSCAVRCFAFAGDDETVELDVAPLLCGPDAATPKRRADNNTNTEDGTAAADSASASDQNQQQVNPDVRIVWRPKNEGWIEGGGNSYLSINAHSLDQDQEGIDLREWVEKGWVNYLDCMYELGENRFRLPHEGGTY